MFRICFDTIRWIFSLQKTKIDCGILDFPSVWSRSPPPHHRIYDGGDLPVSAKLRRQSSQCMIFFHSTLPSCRLMHRYDWIPKLLQFLAIASQNRHWHVASPQQPVISNLSAVMFYKIFMLRMCGVTGTLKVRKQVSDDVRGNPGQNQLSGVPRTFSKWLKCVSKLDYCH